MLELVIVRHGESVRNHASDLAHHGQFTLLEYQLRFDRDETSWDLTQRGIEQARTAGAWIRENIGQCFDRQYVSPFKRTRQTAASLELRCNDWIIDDRLRERDWGDYSAPGLSPYTVEQYLYDLACCGAVNWKREFPNAESVADMIPRCRSFIESLIKQKIEGRVILVTHGGTMKSLELVIERLSIDQADRLAERRLTNCSVLQYQLSNFDETESCWMGRVRFASPTVEGIPVSDWQPIAGC